MVDKIILTAVIPVFNEEEIVSELYRRLTPVLERLNKKYEIIIVDDGSKDRSFEVLRSLHQKDRRVKIIKFSRNFGHHIAITAGIDHAAGEAIVLMDGDLQHPPEEIPRLYKKFNEGYDIVHALRKASKDRFFKKIFSKLFYRIFNKLTNMYIPPRSSVFKVISREVAETLKACRERSRFIPALIEWSGFPSAVVETEQKARFAGRPKYSLWRSFLLAVHSIASFSKVKFRTMSIDAEAQQRPLYIVKEKIGFVRRKYLHDERED